jgi:hypothetical protein
MPPSFANPMGDKQAGIVVFVLQMILKNPTNKDKLLLKTGRTELVGFILPGEGKRMKWHRNMIAVAIVAGVMLSAGRVSAQLFQVATDKAVYVQGEPIKILVTYTGSDVLGFSTSGQSNYTLDGIYTPNRIVLMVLTTAQGPCTWTNIFQDGDEYSLTPGEHSVVGTVIEYGSSSPASFTVIPDPKPQSDFLLDFLYYPGTTTYIPTLAAYSAYGAQFRSSSGPMGVVHTAGYDYICGYTVAADFSVPVMGARAMVRVTTNCTVTMIAKDAQGEELGRVVSPVLTSEQQMMELRANRHITSLEWAPNISNSIVRIDSLLVRIPPILNPSTSNESFRLIWQSVTGETYQVWSSSNLWDWIPVGAEMECTQDALTNEYPIAEEKGMFYRVSRNIAP